MRVARDRLHGGRFGRECGLCGSTVSIYIRACRALGRGRSLLPVLLLLEACWKSGSYGFEVRFARVGSTVSCLAHRQHDRSANSVSLQR